MEVRTLAAVLSTLVSASCLGGSGAGSPPTPSPTAPTPTQPLAQDTEDDAASPVSGCPAPEQETGSLPATYERVGKATGGEVTGDRGTDRILILGDEHRPPRCRYYLAVLPSGGDVVVERIKALPWIPEAPSVLMTVEIDGQPGLEIVAEFGGSMHPHRTGQVFTVKRGSLFRMRAPRPEGVPQWLVPLNDEFVGGVDCAGEPGSIVITVGGLAEGGADDRHYDVTRTFYRARGLMFVPFHVETLTVDIEATRKRWPELADDPFRSCP